MVREIVVHTSNNLIDFPKKTSGMQHSFLQHNSGGFMFRSFFKVAGLCLALALTLGVTSSLHAQTSLGQIAGNVVDSTGGAIPGATITITNTGTQAVGSVNSDGGGFYTATNPRIGMYMLR